MLNTSYLFDFNEIYDFIGCMLRISSYEAYKNALESLESIHGDDLIVNTVENIKKTMSNAMVEDFKFFLDSETSFAEGLLILAVEENIKTIEGLIHFMNGMNSEKLLSYLIESSDSSLTLEKIVTIRSRAYDLYLYIEESFQYGSENKWRLLSMINEPHRYRDKFINFITGFYEEHYKLVKESCQLAAAQQCKSIIDYIEGDPLERIKELTLIDTEKNDLTKIIIGFSYFTEYGLIVADTAHCNTSIIIMGTRHLEMHRLMNMESLTDQNFIEICKVIGDKIRIEILKAMKNGPIYGTQVAEKLNMSSPAVSYHLDQFLASGLVRAEKEGHRLYYYLKPERIGQLIKYLSGLISE